MTVCRKYGILCIVLLAVASFVAGGALFISGCGSGASSATDVPTDGSTSGTDGGTSVLGYAGTVSGTVSTSISSSDGSSTESASGIAIAKGRRTAKSPSPKVSSGTITFKDLDGNPLTDAEGNAYPSVEVGADGTFTMEGLPLGVDFVIEVDVDGDGEADLTHIVSIPKDESGESGSITDIDVNPLTTMAVAKLLQVITEKGANASDLDFSPAAVISQMTAAFKNLFAIMGIDSTITMDQIMAQTIDMLADLFDQLVPDSVKATMDMAESKINLADAETPEDLVLAVIPALLRAGICVADEPGGTDLASIARMSNVEVLTWDEFNRLQNPDAPPQPEGDALVADEGNRIFRSTVIEVDRNFAAMDEKGGGDGPRMGIVIHKHALEQMAGLEFEGKTLSLQDLHTLATDLAKGMGMRLAYGVPMPPMEPGEEGNPGPNPMMFQSANQRGVLVDMQALEERIFQTMGNRGPTNDAERAAQESAVRTILQDVLGGTQAPSLEQLFGGIMSDALVTTANISAKIQNARSHMPYNWSGDSKFYVLADRDRWRYDNARAVTVDVVFDENGQMSKVTYNAAGEGKYYLRCFGGPDSGYMAELIIPTTGRMVFGEKGCPVQGDLADATIFKPVSRNGQTVAFLDAFTESGEFWPIEPALEVPNPWYDPEKAPDPETNPPSFQLHVLVTEPGPDGQAVKVSVAEDGTVTRDDNGNYALEMFWEGPPVDAMMAVLIDVRTGERLQREEGTDGNPDFRVLPEDIVNLGIVPEQQHHIFDIEVPNPMYDPEGDPWYDDINENGLCDAGEPTFSWKEELWNPNDWRSTCVERYYRRSDNNKAVSERDVNWDSPTPKTWTGVVLVPRNFKRRNNAFTFGRPNSAINLLTTFLGQGFFDGTHKLNGQTRVGAFGALALMNLIFDARLYNLEAYVVDYGPEGAMPAKLQVVEAWPWTPPIDDPVMLVLRGFGELASAP